MNPGNAPRRQFEGCGRAVKSSHRHPPGARLPDRTGGLEDTTKYIFTAFGQPHACARQTRTRPVARSLCPSTLPMPRFICPHCHHPLDADALEVVRCRGDAGPGLPVLRRIDSPATSRGPAERASRPRGSQRARSSPGRTAMNSEAAAKLPRRPESGAARRGMRWRRRGRRARPAAAGDCRRRLRQDQHPRPSGCPPDRPGRRSGAHPAAHFSRRAADEMVRRVERIVARVARQHRHLAGTTLPWSGTFHGVGARLLRDYAASIGWTRDSRSTTAKTRPIS